MDLTANGEAKNVVENGVKQGTNLSGWLFRFIQEGWLRKRWRKRWCVLKQDKLYLYEFEPSKTDEEKICGVIELENYQNCAHAPKKDCKKSPHTFALELSKPDNKPSQKKKLASQRELFYPEKEDDESRWIEQLNDKIAAAKLGYAKTLDHVTKARPKPPSSQRRPPTRQHLRERAEQSQLSTDFEADAQVKTKPVKRGHVPTSAIKPPPGAMKPKLDQSNSTSEENIEGSSTNNDDTSLVEASPKLPLKPTVSIDEETKVNDASLNVKSATPPPAPSTALKPKISMDKQTEPDDSNSDTAMSATPPLAPSPALKPKISMNKETKPDDSNSDTAMSATPPLAPSTALKPKISNQEETVPDDASPHKVMPGTPPPAPLKSLKPKLVSLPVQESIIEEELEINVEDASPPGDGDEDILTVEAILEDKADEDSNLYSENEEEQTDDNSSTPAETPSSLCSTNEDETEEVPQPSQPETSQNEDTDESLCDDVNNADSAQTKESKNETEEPESDTNGSITKDGDCAE